jgi:threonine/homoserine/homoserine lactone efflux protein
MWFYAVLPLLAMLIDGGWYILVAYVLSAEAPRQGYLKFKASIDRTAGAVMALLGLKLVTSLP